MESTCGRAIGQSLRREETSSGPQYSARIVDYLPPVRALSLPANWSPRMAEVLETRYCVDLDAIHLSIVWEYRFAWWMACSGEVSKFDAKALDSSSHLKYRLNEVVPVFWVESISVLWVQAKLVRSLQGIMNSKVIKQPHPNNATRFRVRNAPCASLQGPVVRKQVKL